MKRERWVKFAHCFLVAASFLALSVTACAGEHRRPVDESLDGTEWLAVDVVDTKFVDQSNSTLKFAGDGKVNGSAGCNNYTGGVTLDGDSPIFVGAHALREGVERLARLGRKVVDVELEEDPLRVGRAIRARIFLDATSAAAREA